MSYSTQPPSYRLVLSLPGARYAFALAILGRLSYGTVTLALLFTIQNATQSFAITGTVLGAFGIATLTAPLKSRLMDRYGQPLVLMTLGLSFPLAVLALALFAGSLTRYPAILVALGAVAGLTTPPLGPAMRFLWAQMTPTQDLRQRAYSMDSVVEESLYVMGPAIAGGLIAVSSPEAALILTAALALVGTVGLATSPAARTHAARGVSESTLIGVGPLKVRPFLTLLVAVAGAGLALGVIEITVAARAELEGDPASAGYVLAALAAGSVLGGLIWGRRSHHRRRSTHLVGLMAVFGVGIAVASWMPDLLSLGVALFAAGLGLAPIFIVSYIASDALVPHTHRTEATTWVNTVNNFGWSGGAAVAGWFIGQSSLQITFLVGTVLLIIAGGILFVDRRAIDAE